MPRKIVGELERHGGTKYIVIDGQPYVLDRAGKIDKRKKSISINFIPVKKKEYEKRINKLVDALASKINVKELLRQSLYDTSLTDVMLAEKELKKKKPKVRSTKGCLFLQVGKGKVWLRE